MQLRSSQYGSDEHQDNNTAQSNIVMVSQTPQLPPPNSISNGSTTTPPQTPSHYVEPLSETVKNYFVAYPLFLLIIWGAFYVFWDEAALPGGAVYTIIVLEVCAYVLGEIVAKSDLPPQLGMLMAGLILGNIPYSFISEDLYQLVILQLRWLAIVVSVTKGALGIFPGIIWKFRKVIPPLAIAPYFAEAIIWYLGSYYVAGHSSSASFFIAGLYSTMSGILLFPYVDNLEKEIHPKSSDLSSETKQLSPHALEILFVAKKTMGLDAVLGILFAKSALGFMFADDFQSGLIKGPGEVVFGAGLGILWGGLSGLLLTGHKHVVLRVITVILGGTVTFIGMRKLGYPRGTHVGVLIGAFTAISIWRSNKKKVVGLEKIIDTNDKIWALLEPFLFAIIGARINVMAINWSMFGLGFCVWAACTLVRLVTVFWSTQWSGWTLRERLFIVTAWSGKGTLQAAIGPVPIETALLNHLNSDVVESMRRVMELAVLILIFSHIFGYVGVKLWGKKLLSKEDENSAVVV